MAYKSIARTTINGLSYHDYALVKDSMQVGQEVFLEADPLNPHDNKAVKVMFDSNTISMGEDWDDNTGEARRVQIGWLPKTFPGKEVIHNLLIHGLDIKSRIVVFDPKSGALGQVTIGIWIAVEE